jgi:hypothetical protein
MAAEKGILYLKNDSLLGMYENVNSTGETYIDTLYGSYKNTYKLSKSNHFRGTAADSFKNYLTNGAVKIITELMDIVADNTMVLQVVAETFYNYENTDTGRVRESTLDSIKEILVDKEAIFNDARIELDSVIQVAAEYITTKALSLDDVKASYTDTDNKIEDIRTKLYENDDACYTVAEDLLKRIKNLQTYINSLMEYCYTDDNLNVDKLDYIDSQKWFYQTGNVELVLKLAEDPFVYEAGETTMCEQQWSKGLCSDVYAYGGFRFLSASGEAGVENGTAFAKGSAVALNLNAYGQLTNYIRAQANVDVAFAKGEAKAGLSSEYFGFKINGEVGLIKAEGSLILGGEKVNLKLKGDAKFFCADGKAAFEFEDDGEFAVGVDASATVASASAGISSDILKYRQRDAATGQKKRLLGGEITANASAGANFAIYAESENALEFEHVNINASTLKIKATALLGLDLAVTIPTPYFKGF